MRCIVYNYLVPLKGVSFREECPKQNLKIYLADSDSLAFCASVKATGLEGGAMIFLFDHEGFCGFLCGLSRYETTQR